MREIVETFGLRRHFETDTVRPVHLVCMTQYQEDWTFPIISPPQSMTNCLGEWYVPHLAMGGVAEICVCFGRGGGRGCLGFRVVAVP